MTALAHEVDPADWNTPRPEPLQKPPDGRNAGEHGKDRTVESDEPGAASDQFLRRDRFPVSRSTSRPATQMAQNENISEDRPAQDASDFNAVKDELDGSVRLRTTTDGRTTIGDWLTVGPLDDPENRKRAFAWLAERVNTFVNVLRPRMRTLAADDQSRVE